MEKMVKWDRGNWMRDSLDGANLSFEKDRECGFSWPQRSYRCSFCKKEFKSAQALGGHMNVHRRDRARMRLSSPSRDPPSPKPGPNPNLKHNPKPNPSFSSTKSLPYSYMGCHSLLSTSASPDAQRVSATKHSRQDYDTLCRGGDGLKKNKGKLDEVASMGRRKDVRVWKGNTHVRLDLNLGLIQAPKEEDLDLELRLGYP